MHNVSAAYKRAMEKPTRDRGYIQIGLGAISLEAQGSADVSDNNLAYWSNASNLFNNDGVNDREYVTLEENFYKADGSQLIMPEPDGYNFSNTGIATAELVGAIRISFSDIYPIKGITLDFGEYYPTAFKIQTDSDVFEFENSSNRFVTSQNFGETSSITIVATQMVGGRKRLRLKSALMGVGLSYGNSDVSASQFEEYVSAVSEELPSSTFSATILDIKNEYNVDSTDSFINFLEIGQDVSVSMGITLEDGQIEWVNICNLVLESWGSSKGYFDFTAVDKLAHLEGEYRLGNRIYDRSAYSELESIFHDMGLSPDEYNIDNYLATVTLHNPIEPAPHKECIQLICNACRCIVYQAPDGRIMIRSNFALVLDPEDITVDADGTATAYSHIDNVLSGSHDIYVDFTDNFYKADGSQYILPNSNDYLDTGYVSKAISDADGIFEDNPKISLQFEAGMTFFGLHIGFDGNAPREMIVNTYLYGAPVSSEIYTDLEKDTYISYEFKRFDKIEFEFTKGYPRNRVLINKISFGDFNDYRLKKDDMLSSPYGQREKSVKSISVKIFAYQNSTDEQGNVTPELIEDNVWFTEDINRVGDEIEVSNPLISDAHMAETLAEWLGNYYKSNVSYTVEYRGDARLNAADIIHMDSDVLNNMQVAIKSTSLSFNGAWKGQLQLRKALRKGED